MIANGFTFSPDLLFSLLLLFSSIVSRVLPVFFKNNGKKHIQIYLIHLAQLMHRERMKAKIGVGNYLVKWICCVDCSPHMYYSQNVNIKTCLCDVKQPTNRTVFVLFLQKLLYTILWASKQHLPLLFLSFLLQIAMQLFFKFQIC